MKLILGLLVFFTSMYCHAGIDANGHFDNADTFCHWSSLRILKLLGLRPTFLPLQQRPRFLERLSLGNGMS